MYHTQKGECGKHEKAGNHSAHSEAITPTVAKEGSKERELETSTP